MWRGRTEDGLDGRGPSAASERRCRRTRSAPSERGTATSPKGTMVTYRVHRLWAGLAISFVAGNLSGLLGIGGGVFKVPALHLVCGVPIKAAAATSNFMIGVTAAASALLYYGRGEVRPALTAAVVLGRPGGLGAGLGAQPTRPGRPRAAGSSPSSFWRSPPRCSTGPGSRRVERWPRPTIRTGWSTGSTGACCRVWSSAPVAGAGPRPRPDPRRPSPRRAASGVDDVAPRRGPG